MLGRLRELAIKLISIKGVAFILATVFHFQGKLAAELWALFAVIIMGWRAFEKIFGKNK